MKGDEYTGTVLCREGQVNLFISNPSSAVQIDYEDASHKTKVTYLSNALSFYLTFYITIYTICLIEREISIDKDERVHVTNIHINCYKHWFLVI